MKGRRVDPLLHDFVAETGESLARLEADLLRLEREPSRIELLGQVLQTLHGIKGTCGFLELPRIASLAHGGEGLLAAWRDGEAAITPEAVSLLLDCVDRIRVIVDALAARGEEPDGDDAQLLAALASACRGEAVAATPGPVQAWDGAGDVGTGVAGSGEGGTVRVSLALLDRLMTRVDELRRARGRLCGRLGADAGDPEAALQRLDRAIVALEDDVVEARMQPIGTIWRGLPRLVRGLEATLGKRIELALEGEEILLDRATLERLKKPIVHLLRNAADHGLEGPEARRAAGKPEAGRITLSAGRDGDHVVVRVRDDGRGVPAEKLRERLRRQRLLSEPELARIDDGELVDLVFRPGISTVEAATAVSGRGVGLDAVRGAVAPLGGRVRLETEPGRGTRVTLRVPLEQRAGGGPGDGSLREQPAPQRRVG